MIYKTGDTVYSIQEHEIKTHTVQDFKFITWIQKLKIDNEWHPANDFYSTLIEAENANRGNQPSIR